MSDDQLYRHMNSYRELVGLFVFKFTVYTSRLSVNRNPVERIAQSCRALNYNPSHSRGMARDEIFSQPFST